MRIRTITAFVRGASCDDLIAQLPSTVRFLADASERFTSLGYEVQTVRVTTNCFPEWTSTDSAAHDVRRLEDAAKQLGLEFLSVGSVSHDGWLPALEEVMNATTIVNASYAVGERAGRLMDREAAEKLARTLLSIADATDGGGNFRMAMAAECTGGTPYFPVACAPAKPGRSFALGLENSDAVHTAFLGCGGSMDAAETRLVEELSPHVLRIEAAAQKLAAASGWAYLGLDSSVAPGLDSPCLPASFELLGVGRFGALGTLSAVAAVTAALKKLPCQLVGYCGLMLPLCEDTGLAAAGKQGELRVADLVLFSAVCGCGIDTVPVPGNGSGEAADAANLRGLAALLLDIATLAHRLKKPLSVRVLPCPGKRPGEATSFTSPYLVDSCVLPLASGGTQ